MKCRLFMALLLLLGKVAAPAAPADEPYAGVMPADHRAIAVPVDPADPLINFAVPGARVDAISTQKSDNGKIVTKFLAKNLLIVAIDTEVDPQNPQKLKSLVFTLAVPKKEAESLAAEIKKGKVSLLERKPDKDAAPRTK